MAGPRGPEGITTRGQPKVQSICTSTRVCTTCYSLCPFSNTSSTTAFSISTLSFTSCDPLWPTWSCHTSKPPSPWFHLPRPVLLCSSPVGSDPDANPPPDASACQPISFHFLQSAVR